MGEKKVGTLPLLRGGARGSSNKCSGKPLLPLHLHQRLITLQEISIYPEQPHSQTITVRTCLCMVVTAWHLGGYRTYCTRLLLLYVLIRTMLVALGYAYNVLCTVWYVCTVCTVCYVCTVQPADRYRPWYALHRCTYVHTSD